MTFGESLMNIRKEKGISRKDFAEQLEIPYTTLRNYETNQREPGHKLLIKMAMLLHVTVDELIGYQPQYKNSPSTAEAAPGEKELEMFDKFLDSLISMGLVRNGKDITDRQAEVLSAVYRILDATF